MNYTPLNSGLAGPIVEDIYIDTEGNKWFATDVGVSKLVEDVSVKGAGNKMDLVKVGVGIAPNPFYNKVDIFISGQREAVVEVFDLKGQRVDAFAGMGHGAWDAGKRAVADGIYYFRVTTGKDVYGIKVVKNKN
jgi:hypothetical protein